MKWGTARGWTISPRAHVKSHHSRRPNLDVQSLWLVGQTWAHSSHLICAQRHMQSDKQQQQSRSTETFKAALQLWPPAAQLRCCGGVTADEQSSCWRTRQGKQRVVLTSFTIFHQISITTCITALSESQDVPAGWHRVSRALVLGWQRRLHFTPRPEPLGSQVLQLCTMPKLCFTNDDYAIKLCNCNFASTK